MLRTKIIFFFKQGAICRAGFEPTARVFPHLHTYGCRRPGSPLQGGICRRSDRAATPTTQLSPRGLLETTRAVRTVKGGTAPFPSPPSARAPRGVTLLPTNDWNHPYLPAKAARVPGRCVSG